MPRSIQVTDYQSVCNQAGVEFTSLVLHSSASMCGNAARHARVFFVS